MHYSLNIFPAFFSIAMFGTIAYFMWRQPGIRGARAFAVSATGMMLSTIILFLASSLKDETLAFGILKNINLFGYGVATLAFVCMIALFTDNRFFSSFWVLAFFALIQVFTVIFNWTTQLQNYDYTIIVRDGWRLIDFKTGPWYQVSQIYIFTLSAIDLYMLVRFIGISGRRYLNSTLLLVFSSISFYLIAYVHSYILSAHIKPINYLPYVWTIPSLVAMAALYMSRSGELVPAALRAAVESTSDLMLILDTKGKVIDCNRATAQALGVGAGEIIGRPAEKLVPEWDRISRMLGADSNETAKQQIKVVLLERTYILITAKVAGDSGEEIGKTLVFHDITELEQRESAERKAKQYRELTRSIIKTQEDERNRIGRELHDDFGHQFLTLSLNIEALRKKGVLPEQEIESLADLVRNISNSLMEIYRGLKPTVIEKLGLAAAIQSQIREIESQGGLKIQRRIAHIDRDDIPYDTAIGIYRIFQEAMSNIIKHSAATEAEVVLERTCGGLMLTVADNGCGMDFDVQSSPHGIGLTGMRERADAMSARFELESSPGQGARIKLFVPLRESGGPAR